MLHHQVFLFITSCFLFCLSFLPFANSTEQISQSALPNGTQIFEFRLDNKLQVLLVPQESDSLDTVSLLTHVQAGSVDDCLNPSYRCGLAHFLEHALFGGTKNFPADVYAREMTRFGTFVDNATTYFNRTNYFSVTPSANLENLIKMNADRFQNIQIDPTNFELQRGAVRGELAMHKSRVDYQESLLTQKALFGGTPYEFLTIGDDSDLEKMTAEQATHFFKEYYSPGNMTVILVGNFDRKVGLSLVEKYYGQIPFVPFTVLKTPKTTPITTQKVLEFSSPNQPTESLVINFQGPAAELVKDSAALEMISDLLARSPFSLLRRDMVKTKDVISVSSGTFQFKDTSLFRTEFVLNKKDSSEVSKAFFQALERIKTQSYGADLLSTLKKKKLIDFSLVLEKDDPPGISLAKLLSNSISVSNDFLYAMNQSYLYQTLTVGDLAKVIEKYLKPDQAVLVKIKPLAAPEVINENK